MVVRWAQSRLLPTEEHDTAGCDRHLTRRSRRPDALRAVVRDLSGRRLPDVSSFEAPEAR